MADLALLPNVLWTPDGGALENAIDGVRATITGGSTLTGAAKRRNDYQRLASTFPSLGYRASGAATNLLYALNADAPSFEGGTVGGYLSNGMSVSNIGTRAWHGTRCLQGTQAAANWRAYRTLTAATAAGAQYTLAAMVKGGAGSVGQVARLSLFDDVTGLTNSPNITLTGDWQFLVVTKTFDAASTTRGAYLYGPSIVGAIIYWDAISLTAGATVPQFDEKECVATSCTVPTPFAAGEPVSFLVFVWTPWAGNDGVDHYLLDTTVSGTNRVFLYKTAANVLTLRVNDAAGANKNRTINVDAANWPAGTMKAIAGSLTADNTMRLALGGTLSAAGAGAGVRETAIGANLYAGTSNGGVFHLNGIILPYIYRGVAWGDEECQYMSSGAVTPYSPDRSAMYCHHPNKAIYALKAPYQYIDARRDN